MKVIGIRDIDKFPWPTPPPTRALQQALQLLQMIGAVGSVGGSAYTGIGTGTGIGNWGAGAGAANLVLGVGADREDLTDLGRELGKLALHPRLAKVRVWVASRGGGRG